MRKPLSIGIFEKEQRLLSLLHNSLAIDRYIITPCSFHGHSLAAFLETISIQWKLTQSSRYDLLIIEIPSTELVGKTLAVFERIAILKSIPIILLTDAASDELKALSTNITILPLSFHRLFPIQDLFTSIERATGTILPLSTPLLQMIIHWQREQYDTTLQLEQVIIDRQDRWLNQRNEWFHQLHTWLSQRDEWLSQRSRLPDPQYEWLHEQHVWIEHQHNEVNQQFQWLQYNQAWLIQRQRKLDLLKLHRPF